MNKFKPLVSIVGLSALLLTGCATTESTSSAGRDAELAQRQATLDAREQDLRDKENMLRSREAEIAEQQARSSEMMARQSIASESSTMAKQQDAEPVLLMAGSDLLPPNAKQGECYARVWEPATYKTITETVLLKEASEEVDVIPAVYEMQTKRVKVSEASSKLVTTPAVYATEQVTTLVRDEKLAWHETQSRQSPLVADDVVAFAKKHSDDDIAGATPGMCFHEHRKSALVTNEDERVMVSEAYEVVEVIPAKYETVEETIVVKEASTRLVKVPATYKNVSKQVLVKPATTEWKKGTGPIQRIDSATGEIMCLVEVPAVYKTVTTRVVDTPETTETVVVPAVTKVIKVRKEVAPAREVRKTIPAQYVTVTKTDTTAGDLVWHEVHNLTMNTESRTGRQICLVKHPAVYKTTAKRVVKTPAKTVKVDIPAKYEDITVRTLVSEAQERRTKVPAEYTTLSREELAEEGRMEWRSILCETNMTYARVSQIQQALMEKGFDPGPIDGVIGPKTIAAMNRFQKANDLPVDEYLNMESIRALGISGT